MSEASRSGEHESTSQGRKSLAELSTMFELRRELAEAEIRSDQDTTRRFAIVGGAGLVAVLTGLPLLLSILTGRADEALKLNFPWISVSVALAALAGGVLVTWSAWRRFRSEFLGLRESLQEVQEDLIWLRDRFEGEESEE